MLLAVVQRLVDDIHRGNFAAVVAGDGLDVGAEVLDAGLDQRGHRIINSVGAFGGFQGILFDWKNGVMMGGSDPRKDGLAIGY